MWTSATRFEISIQVIVSDHHLFSFQCRSKTIMEKKLCCQIFKHYFLQYIWTPIIPMHQRHIRVQVALGINNWWGLQYLPLREYRLGSWWQPRPGTAAGMEQRVAALAKYKDKIFFKTINFKICLQQIYKRWY